MLTNAKNNGTNGTLTLFSFSFSFTVIRKVFVLACSFRFEWLLPKKNWRRYILFFSVSGLPVSSATKAKMRSNLFRQTEVLNTRRIMSEFFKHPIRIPQSTLFSRFSFSCVFVCLPFSTLIGVESSKIHLDTYLSIFPQTEKKPIKKFPEQAIHTHFQIIIKYYKQFVTKYFMDKYKIDF